jgi:hypothetical protein
MLEVEVTDMATLLGAVRKVYPRGEEGICWFRGHACADWSLVPSVHRYYDSRGERNLIGRFMIAAPTRYRDCPAVGDRGSWICLMQHFGLPTRLLDWTSSLVTALYFAIAHDPRPGPAAIWSLLPLLLNKELQGNDTLFTVHHKPPEPYLHAAFSGGAGPDNVVAVYGEDVDLRMSIQEGAFTIHGDDTPLEGRLAVQKCMAKFVIPEHTKPIFDDDLRMMGIRRSMLFPDLANLALDLANDRLTFPRK